MERPHFILLSPLLSGRQQARAPLEAWGVCGCDLTQWLWQLGLILGWKPLPSWCVSLATAGQGAGRCSLLQAWFTCHQHWPSEGLLGWKEGKPKSWFSLRYRKICQGLCSCSFHFQYGNASDWPRYEMEGTDMSPVQWWNYYCMFYVHVKPNCIKLGSAVTVRLRSSSITINFFFFNTKMYLKTYR